MAQELPGGENIVTDQTWSRLFPGGAMKSSKTIRVQITLGELVSALWDETETLFNFERNESSRVVTHLLNDLSTRPMIEVVESSAGKKYRKEPTVAKQ
jgi:hypothetical protein